MAPPPASEVPAYLWLGSGFLQYWLHMMEEEWELGRVILSEGAEERAAWEDPLVSIIDQGGLTADEFAALL